MTVAATGRPLAAQARSRDHFLFPTASLFFLWRFFGDFFICLVCNKFIICLTSNFFFLTKSLKLLTYVDTTHFNEGLNNMLINQLLNRRS